MNEIKNFGVYQLPDGNSYVAVRGGSGTFYLFHCTDGLRLPPAFQVTAGGRIYRWFNSGPEWGVEDLADTGETFAEGGEFNCPE